ncbi:MAG: chitobiase/beta-hexosaminidase C-terminal domain-containing protein, partial [Clostridia bacterium]|nr:chitobiase/beta-hexosaminidase C-terminal domain-containing protein [Clostridia bacterium]
MRKKLLALLTLVFVLSLSIGVLPAYAKSVAPRVEATNVAADKAVSFTDLEGHTLYQRGFVSANDPLPENLITLASATDYQWLRFNNAVWLASDPNIDRGATGNAKIGWAIIDLGATYTVEGVGTQFWNDWAFSDVVIQIANNADFSDAYTVFNNDSDNSLGLGKGKGVGYVEVYTELQKFSCPERPARYVRATATANGYSLFSRIEVYGREVNYAPTAPGEVTPVWTDYPGGAYVDPIAVTLNTVYENAEIRYTTDGSYPTKSSTLYTGAINTAELKREDVMIRAIAVVNGVSSYALDLEYSFKNVDTKTYGENLVQGKTATAYKIDGSAINVLDLNGGKTLAAVTDGACGTGNSIQLEGLGWIQVDMGEAAWFNKFYVLMWHDWVFRGITIQVSETADFSKGVTTVVSTDIGPWIVPGMKGTSMDESFNYNREWISNYEQGTANGGGFTFNTAPVYGR